MSRIQERYYIAINLELRSPLSVANGDDRYTDADVVRSADGEVFLPGTSIAGVFRAYMDQKEKSNAIMGFSEEEKGRMSALFIRDAYFEQPKVSVRDGVRLKDHIVEPGGKFDFEMIETGAKTTLYLEYVKRENDAENGLAWIAKMIQGMDCGDIRFGAKKNRGFGSVKVQQVYKAEFSCAQRKEWIAFCSEGEPIQQQDYEWNDWKTSVQPQEEKYVTISLPLRLDGGISIRKYSADPSKADFEHITCNEKPVIPGSSWNGAIRARINEILEEVGCGGKKRKKLIDFWFGYVEKNEACQSSIIFGESILEGSTRLVATRNKINRFDASTVEGGLYTEISYFGGTTNLQIKIRKKDGYEGLFGMILLVLDEIREGHIAIGGQTAVGRGIFKGNGELQIKPDIVSERADALVWLNQDIQRGE